MNTQERKSHWEKIYETKALKEVSWFQPVPQTSLSFIEKACVPKDAKIIDVGGGDSFLVDHLLELGYTNVTVLDISNAAIARAKQRLGEKAKHVNWIVSDITQFKSSELYDLWHDRAAFHFLNNDADIETYVQSVKTHTKSDAKLIVGTFSKEGPLKCSGIEITQYSDMSLVSIFQEDWENNEALTVMHPTPFNTEQAFVFVSFSKRG